MVGNVTIHDPAGEWYCHPPPIVSDPTILHHQVPGARSGLIEFPLLRDEGRSWNFLLVDATPSKDFIIVSTHDYDSCE